MSVRTALTIAGLIGALSAGVAIGAAHGSTETSPAPSVAVQAVQEQEAAPATYLGENDPIVPLQCGVNLNCAGVDQMRAAQAAKSAKHAKSTSSKTVKTSSSSNGASSTTVTTKSPAGSSTVAKSRTAKGVTTTSRSTTVSK